MSDFALNWYWIYSSNDISNALQSAALLGSLSCSGERRGTVVAAFRADLVRWVQTLFIPFVRERLPDCMLYPLLTASCDWGRQLYMTPASLGAAAAVPGTGGASILTAVRRQRLVALSDGSNWWSVPAARRWCLRSSSICLTSAISVQQSANQHAAASVFKSVTSLPLLSINVFSLCNSIISCCTI
jgi:hypothetical protein